MSDIDPRDVPILAELEEEFRRMVADELALAKHAGVTAAGAAARGKSAPATVPSPTPAQGRRRRGERAPVLSTGRRILGRAAVAGALAGVVGASALATKSVVGGGREAPGPVVLEHAEGHQLVLRHYQGRLCADISFADDVASRCTSKPLAGGIRPLSALTSAGRVVAGVTGTGVAAVQVQSGRRTADATTHAVGGEGNKGLRWFAVLLPSVPRDRAMAAVVIPRGGGGPSVADCSLGSIASCRSARDRAERSP